jgi:hypothetical protein
MNIDFDLVILGVSFIIIVGFGGYGLYRTRDGLADSEQPEKHNHS